MQIQYLSWVKLEKQTSTVLTGTAQLIRSNTTSNLRKAIYKNDIEQDILNAEKNIKNTNREKLQYPINLKM